MACWSNRDFGQDAGKTLVWIWLDGESLFKKVAHPESATSYRCVMRTFLVDISAYEIWFGPASGIRVPRPLERVAEFQGARALQGDLPLEQLSRLRLSWPIHIAVPEHNRLHSSQSVIAHAWDDPPAGSFVRVSSDVYVESPIALAVRLAPRLKPGALAMLMGQLMGSYQLTCDGFVSRRPLASPDEVRGYLDRAPGVRGVKAVRDMLRYIPCDLASPAEARAAAMLSLPVKWGGKGLPMPEANGEVEVQGPRGPAVRYGDLLWRKWSLIVEYDSDAFHTGADRLNADAARRTQLQAAGYAVISLTRAQLDDPAAFDLVVEAIRRAMGKRACTYGVKDVALRERRLRAELAEWQRGDALRTALR